ncbi:MAG: hypothetical protein V3U96_04805 [Paracoccaceae bacterium]
MRLFYPVILALVVSACAPEIPDSAEGVGFETYQDYQQQRENDLTGSGTIQLGGEISDETIATTGAPITAIAAIPDPVETVEPVQLNRDNPLISDEQDFSAVSSRETIESDAQRRAAQQQAYQVIAPTALPTRRGGSGASIVEFALSTTNLVGQPIHRRSNLSGTNRYQRNCAKYTSSDLAQQAFLKAGGPQRDPKGIDPDGDGFACFWDPAPFRQAVRN